MPSTTALAHRYHLCSRCFAFRRGSRCHRCNGFGEYLAAKLDDSGLLPGVNKRLLVAGIMALASTRTTRRSTAHVLEREARELAGHEIGRRGHGL